MKSLHRAKKSTREREAQFLKFERFRQVHNYAGPDERSISAFLVQHCLRNDSAKTVRKVLSQLRVSHRVRKIPFVSEDDGAAIEDIVKALEFRDINPTKRVIALRGRTIAKLTNALNLNNLEERCLAICINMGHDGLMRGLEITQRNTREDRGSIVADFQPMADDKSTIYSLDRSKTHRSGGQVSISLGRIAAKGEWDAHSLIKFHLATNGLGENPSAPFFPAFVTTSWLRRRLKQLVAKHGINPNLVGNHSLRSGGATDLFCSNIPTWVIMKFGRWKSNAVLLYQRDEEDLLQRVKKGFMQTR